MCVTVRRETWIMDERLNLGRFNTSVRETSQDPFVDSRLLCAALNVSLPESLRAKDRQGLAATVMS